MGYTHYCYKPMELPVTQWEMFIGDFNKVLPNFKHLLDVNTDQKLVVNDTEIFFNGIGENSHETFHFPRVEDEDDAFSFCKTARKPYDIAVCSALIIAVKRFSNVKVSSDGDINDWKDAMNLCQTHLGYGEQFKFNADGVLVGGALN